VLNGRLKRVGATELRIYNKEANGPVHGDGEADEEDGACDQACVAKGIWLPDDASATATHQSTILYTIVGFAIDYIILLAMFIKALRMLLRGRALSRWSSGSKTCSATVTLGASMPVRSGSRCTLSLPGPPSSM
jgi:hypothetical protein